MTGVTIGVEGDVHVTYGKLGVFGCVGVYPADQGLVGSTNR